MQYKFIISGRIPSKKNSKQAFVKNGKMTVIPSKNYSQWHKIAIKELLTQKVEYGSMIKCPLKRTECLIARFWHPDARLYDLSNKFESVADLMVDCGLLEDDNYSVIPQVEMVSESIDRKNPRCEVTIIV